MAKEKTPEKRERNRLIMAAYRARIKAGQPVKKVGKRVLLTAEQKRERRKAHDRKCIARRSERRRLTRLQVEDRAIHQMPLSVQRAQIAASVAKAQPVADPRPVEATEDAIRRGVRYEVLPTRWEAPRRYPAPGWSPRAVTGPARVGV